MRTCLTVVIVVAGLASVGPERPALSALERAVEGRLGTSGRIDDGRDTPAWSVVEGPARGGVDGAALKSVDGQAARTQAGAPSTPPRTWDERRIDLPIVGQSVAYVPKAATNRVVLFLSGDGGWNLGVVDMARRIAPSAAVIGISVPQLVRSALRDSVCWYPAGDLEVLAHAAEKRLGLNEYRPPALVGYSSGATIVYAALAPAPPTTFAGGISLGFCPDLDVARPICHSTGWTPTYDARKHLTWLPAVTTLPKPWYLLHGVQDQVCSPEQTRKFVSGMKNAHLVELEGTGHGFAKPVHWGEPFDNALVGIWKANEPPPRATPTAPSFSAIEARLDKLDLPLEYRWPHSTGSAYLIFFSGDGGWASLDDAVAARLTEHGVAVVGVNSLRYFWRMKPPAQVGADLRNLLAAVGRPVFVGGYSFGAEVPPVVVRGWPPAERSMVDGFVLVSPSRSASFEIDPLDWVRTPAEDPATRVAPAVRESGLPTLCVMGADDTESGCLALLKSPPFQVASLPGSHHFDGNYHTVGDTIAKFIQSVGGREPRSSIDVLGYDRRSQGEVLRHDQ